MSTNRYFIAIIPPQPVFDEALLFQNYFKERYQSKAALHSPPHITLLMPFQWPDQKKEDLIEKLNTFAKGRPDFEVTLKNFGCFAPRVIFLSVITNPILQKLEGELQRHSTSNLNLFNAPDQDKPFHPHLTLAFRDLTKENFAPAWKEFEFKSYHSTFRVSKITVLQHNGTVWEPFHDCNF